MQQYPLKFNIVPTIQFLKMAGKTPSEKGVELSFKLIKEEMIEELEEAINLKDEEKIIDAVGDSMVVLTNLMYYSGIDMQRFMDRFDKIERENLAKICFTEEDAELTVKLYREGKHPDKPGTVIDTYYTCVDDRFYPVLRTSDDKIMKAHNYLINSK